MFTRLAVFSLLICFAAPAAFAFDAPKDVRVVKTAKGDTLADDDGMTLYVFDREEAFESRCYARCAKNWPPLEARRKDVRIGRFLSVERNDDTFQWIYGGKPLYRWIRDEEKGDITGDVLADVWHVARP